MPTPGQAFKAYYARMTDSDLLAVARNRSSFLPLAQTQMVDELRKRQLAVPAETRVESRRRPTLLTKLVRRLRREPPTRPEPPIQPEPPRAASPEPAAVIAPPPAMPTDRGTHKFHAVGHIGATEDQVSMVGTLPERVNKHGVKIEDLAGTGQHDSLGG